MGREVRMFLHKHSGYIPLLSNLGCFRNGLRVISYFILSKLQAAWDPGTDTICSVFFSSYPSSFLSFLLLTSPFLPPSRRNSRGAAKRLKCKKAFFQGATLPCDWLLGLCFCYTIDSCLLAPSLKLGPKNEDGGVEE
jgi:hypothetical protein